MRCRKGTAAIMALKPETHPECSCGNIPSALGDCELASLVIRERAELPLGGKKMREMFPQEHSAGDRRIAGASIRRCTLCLHKPGENVDQGGLMFLQEHFLKSEKR